MVKIKDASIKEVENVVIQSKKAKHALRVWAICEEIAKELNKYSESISVDIDILCKGALLHDIGKVFFMNDDYHHLASAAIIEKLFDCTSEQGDREFTRKLQSIILSHKGDFKPDSDVAVEAAILRMADKIDKYNKSTPKKAKHAYKKSAEIIRIYFRLNSREGDLKKMEAACEKIYMKAKEKANGKSIGDCSFRC